ncbi:MAG: NERD domain-containing protein [Pseudomonadota bacterium]
MRDAVVERLRRARPEARIVHELNSAGTGSIRFDIAAISRDEIVVVEIKSRLDKLDRLDHQVPAMLGCSHYAIACLDEKFLVESENLCQAMRPTVSSKPACKFVPSSVRKLGAAVWIYPQDVGVTLRERAWLFPSSAFGQPLPEAALEMLWADELRSLCNLLRISWGRRSNMSALRNAIRWHATGQEITKGICRELRARTFSQADAPVLEDA